MEVGIIHQVSQFYHTFGTVFRDFYPEAVVCHTRDYPRENLPRAPIGDKGTVLAVRFEGLLDGLDVPTPRIPLVRAQLRDGDHH